jgi:hypothetical protein
MTELTSAANRDIDPVFGIDVRLLQIMAESIRTAHAINPNSWSVNQLVSGSLILYVESVSVVIVRPEGGDIGFFRKCRCRGLSRSHGSRQWRES